MKTHVLFIFSFCALLIGCQSVENNNIRSINKQVLDGKVEKGPYASGSRVTVFELDADFSQTGKVYSTSINGDNGYFEQRDMQLSSQYVELQADGYYFNEVENSLSSSPLTLLAISDLSQTNQVNINVLTTLEYYRILYLIKQGTSFKKACNQAHSEVLKVFGLQAQTVDDAQELSIWSDVEMLAISSILQGHLTTAQLSALIADMGQDLKTDGTLNNPVLASQLKNNTIGLSAEQIVDNLKGFDVSLNVSAAQLQECFDLFEKNTDYMRTEYISYPEESDYGPNVLAMDGDLQAMQRYSLAAITPSWAPLSLEIVGKDWYYSVAPMAPVNWMVFPQNTQNGRVSQIIKVIEPGKLSMLSFMAETGDYTIYFYEYGSDQPTREKRVRVK